MPQLDFSTYISQVFWLGIFFSILCVMMVGVISPKIALTLHNRHKIMAEKKVLTEALLKEIEGLREKNKKLIDHAHLESIKKVHERVGELSHQRHQKKIELEQETQKSVFNIAQILDVQKKEMLNSSQEMVVGLVKMILGKITDTPFSEEEIKKAMTPKVSL